MRASGGARAAECHLVAGQGLVFGDDGSEFRLRQHGLEVAETVRGALVDQIEDAIESLDRKSVV